MRNLVIGLLLVLGAAASCTRSSSTSSTTAVEPPTTTSDAGTAPSHDAADPVHEVTRPDAAVAWQPVVDEVEGEGSCKVDSDCELSNWQPGCSCNGTCTSYAISKRLLAQQVKRANCPKVRTKPRPPPAPCRRPTHYIREAVCRAGTCFSVRETRRPEKPDLGL